jgi:hypothetical protein
MEKFCASTSGLKTVGGAACALAAVTARSAVSARPIAVPGAFGHFTPAILSSLRFRVQKIYGPGQACVDD